MINKPNKRVAKYKTEITKSKENAEIEKPAAKDEFSWKKDIAAPMILILFAGVVGIIVGHFWEFFKFQRETLFEKQIDLITESRKQTADIFVDFDTIRRQVRANENHLKIQKTTDPIVCTPDYFKDQVEQLKTVGLRVNYINEFSKGVISNTGVPENITTFKEQLEGYIDCLLKNNTCEVCTDRFPKIMEPLHKIIELHTAEISLQINQNK